MVPPRGWRRRASSKRADSAVTRLIDHQPECVPLHTLAHIGHTLHADASAASNALGIQMADRRQGGRVSERSAEGERNRGAEVRPSPTPLHTSFLVPECSAVKFVRRGGMARARRRRRVALPLAASAKKPSALCQIESTRDHVCQLHTWEHIGHTLGCRR